VITVNLPDSVRLTPTPLSAEAFAPYGAVLRHGRLVRVNDGLAERRDALFNLPGLEPEARLCLSVFDVGVRALPFSIVSFERHPHTAQAFLPITECRALVVVAGTAADGGVDPGTMLAFAAAPGEGVLYAPGVWHLGLTSLDRPGQFHMAMWLGSRPDTEMLAAGCPVTVGAA
jgi:ureidoglycolate lyase